MVTREKAEAEVLQFNTWYDQQPSEVKECYRGRSHIGNYEFCFVCSGQDFYESAAELCPIGVTLQPLIEDLVEH